MSEPILPLRQWPSGIQQASVPANDNALRLEALSRPCLGVANDESAPNDGDVWIVGNTPTGAFAGFDEHDIALYHVDQVTAAVGWHAWAPVEGLRLVVNDVRKVFDGTEWIDDPAGGGGSGTVESIVAGTGIFVDDSDPANPIVSVSGAAAGLPWFYVTDYVDSGDIDDTNAIQRAIDAAGGAGGGVVYMPARQGTGANGEYIVGGGLQDTSRGNAQLLVPAVASPTDSPVTIVIMGEFPPPPNVSVIGATPTPDAQTVIQGTLNTGSGGALLGGWGPVGSFQDHTRVNLILNNLTIRMPSNPVLTAIDASHIATLEADHVFIDTGSYYVQGLPEPTTSTSFGLRMPRANNGAFSRLGTVNVIGFYNGFEFAEHSTGFHCQAVWGCKNGFVFNTAQHHASVFERLMAHHCERVIVATGIHFVNILQLNVEHATSGWWVTDYDIDDASNYLRGTVQGWQSILSGTGADSTFSVNGAARLNITRLGWENRVEQVIVSSAITFAGRHANKHILHPSADTTPRTWTIPANSSVPYPVGTTLTFVNQDGAGDLTIAITSDTMRLAGAGTTGSRTLAANGIATAVKVASTEWVINGTGLT